MSEHSDTPETEAEYAEAQDFPRSSFVVPLDQFQEVERQRNEARAELANWKQLYAEAVELCNLFQSQRDEAREENARLREVAILCRNVLNDVYQLPTAKQYRDTPCLSRDYASAVSISLSKLNQLLTP